MPTTTEAHYTFPLANFVELQLQNEVAAALPSVLGVCGTPGVSVDIVFAAPLAAADQAALAAVVAAHAPVLTVQQKLDGTKLPPRVAAALVVRMSTQWSALAPAKQATVQGVIDAATTAIAGLLA